MNVRSRHAPRRGSVAIETVLVLNVLFLLTLGVIVLGMGVFRYQEMCHLARGCAGPRSTGPAMPRTHGERRGHGDRRLQQRDGARTWPASPRRISAIPSHS